MRRRQAQRAVISARSISQASLLISGATFWRQELRRDGRINTSRHSLLSSIFDEAQPNPPTVSDRVGHRADPLYCSYAYANETAGEARIELPRSSAIMRLPGREGHVDYLEEPRNGFFFSTRASRHEMTVRTGMDPGEPDELLCLLGSPWQRAR